MSGRTSQTMPTGGIDMRLAFFSAELSICSLPTSTPAAADSADARIARIQA